MAVPVPIPTGTPARSRRPLIMAGGGLAALLLFFFVVRPMLLGGGGDTVEPAVSRPTGSAAPTTTSTAPPGPKAEETFEVFSGTKNPFAALIDTTPTASSSVGTSTGTAAGPSGTTGPTTGGSPTTGGTTTGGATTPTTAVAASPTSGTGSVEPGATQRVALMEVFVAGGQTVANVRVNDTMYERLRPGAVFAQNYKVVSLSGQCGSFLFGDEGFRLCKGEEVLK